MTGLRTLHIVDASMPSWVLNDCPFRVDTFSFASDCDADLVRFLELQEQIMDLALNRPPCHPHLLLGLTALPKLAKVVVQPSWISVLVPGRPICDVTFRNMSAGADAEAEFLSLSTTPIQRLSIIVDRPHILSNPRLDWPGPNLDVLLCTYPFSSYTHAWVSPSGFFTPRPLNADFESSKKLGLSLSGWLNFFQFLWSFATSAWTP
jgi:hypothetical protein